MHLGNAWTALLAWLSARRAGGLMTLRMEDLDPQRSKPEFARAILDDLTWLGLDWDEGPDKGGPHPPYVQSQRRHIYQEHLDALAARHLTYACWCTRAQLRDAASAPHADDAEPVYAGTCLRRDPAEAAALAVPGRSPGLRLRAPDEEVAFTDRVLGPQRQHLPSACGDFLLRRADGVHAYQLAVVVDDALHGVTEVVRGADLLSSTPRQIALFRLFGWREPAYAHVPLLVDADGRRLSKRRGDVDLGQLRQAGVSPRVVVGYLAWLAGLVDRPRPAAPEELVDGFSFDPMPPGPVVVPELWMERLP